jgi:hypothetical protein
MFGDRKAMSYAEQEAERMFKPIGFARPLTDHEKAQRALHENLERLRAERLQRQAAERGTTIDRV